MQRAQARESRTVLEQLSPAMHALARSGNAAAQYELSRMYGFGLGVKADRAAQRDWTERAAAQGHVEARKTLDQMLRNDALNGR